MRNVMQESYCYRRWCSNISALLASANWQLVKTSTLCDVHLKHNKCTITCAHFLLQCHSAHAFLYSLLCLPREHSHSLYSWISWHCQEIARVVRLPSSHGIKDAKNKKLLPETWSYVAFGCHCIRFQWLHQCTSWKCVWGRAWLFWFSCTRQKFSNFQIAISF